MSSTIRDNLASACEGRTVSAYMYITLEPKQKGVVLGEIDQAREIGLGLINEAIRLLKTAAEAEGFLVKVTGETQVY